MAEQAQYLGTGKRKTSVARVILRPGDGKTWFNGRTLEDYFPRATHRTLALAPLKTAGVEEVRHPRPRPRRLVRPPAGGWSRNRPRALVEADPELRGAAQARGLPHPRRPRRRAQEGWPPQGSARRHSSRSDIPGLRRYFGTDGVRGVVGRSDRRPGRAARQGVDPLVWARRVFVGRDTRGSGPEPGRVRAVSWRPAGTPCSPACS